MIKSKLSKWDGKTNVLGFSGLHTGTHCCHRARIDLSLPIDSHIALEIYSILQLHEQAYSYKSCGMIFSQVELKDFRATI